MPKCTWRALPDNLKLVSVSPLRDRRIAANERAAKRGGACDDKSICRVSMEINKLRRRYANSRRELNHGDAVDRFDRCRPALAWPVELDTTLLGQHRDFPEGDRVDQDLVRVVDG